MRLQRFRLAILGYAVIVGACAGIVLAGTFNRDGTPESTLRLSERELELPSANGSGDHNGNTPLTFRLSWRVESIDGVDPGALFASATRVAWITPSKLTQLGVPIAGRERRDAWVSTLLVLEFDGSAHTRAVSRACDPASPTRDVRNCEYEVKKSSRLYVIDAGRSAASLRAQYPDRTRFAIVSGVIKLAQDSNTGELTGYVGSVSGDTVQGVEPLRSTIDPATGEMLWQRLLTRQYFDAVIAFGRRLEPWNVSIEGRQGGSAPPPRPGF